MGRDKAALRPGGPGTPTLIERALGCLEPHTQAVLLAVGRRRRPELSGYVQVLDAVEDAGPLAGLAAGLEAVREAHGDSHVCVLACDMPYADWQVFEALLATAVARDADVVLARADTPDGSARLEPRCAVYHTRVLPAVEASLRAGDRRLVAFHGRTLTGHAGGVRSLRIEHAPVDAARALANVNTPAEFAQVAEEADA